MGNHGIRRIQDRLGGAVVLLQTDDPGTPVLLFKAQYIFNGGAPEPVNTLVVVTHHADIFVTAGKEARQQVLHMVCILVLVHQYIAEFLLVILPHIFMFLQQPDSDADDVIKIQGIVILKLLLIPLIGPGDVKNPQIIGFFGPAQQILRCCQLVLFLADGIQDHLCRESLVIQAHILDDILHDPLGIGGIIDGKALVIAHPLNIPAQDPAAGRVEGHGPDVLGFGTQHQRQTFLQLIGSLVCKGNGNDAPGHSRTQGAEPVGPVKVKIGGFISKSLQEIHILLGHRIGNFIAVRAAAEAHQIGNPVDQHGGFSASGTCKQQKRALCGQNGLPLHGIQV